MPRDKTSSNDKLDEQLEKTSSAHISYDEQLTLLKEIFYDTYERSIVIGVLTVIKKQGHSIDQTAAENFIEPYEAGNLDETQIKWFKKAYRRYNESLMDFLNNQEEEG